MAWTRLFRASPGTSPADRALDERLGEVPFEAAGDGQVTGVVPIAAANDPEHAEVRLAVTAGTDTKHGGTITQGCERSGGE